MIYNIRKELKYVLTTKQKNLIKISILGFFSALMILMMLYVIFAQIFLSYLEGSFIEQLNLSIIIIGMFSISLFSSIIAGYLLSSDDLKKSSILLSSFLAYVFSLFTIIFISYLSLYLYYPFIFDGLYGLDYFFIVSVVIVYFTTYVLPQFFWLYIIEIIFYYLYFVILLNVFYEEKEEKNLKIKPRSGRYI